ncbi:hypothetical protein K435DRAFT_809904 [Dendrothele bispora CBS 962.96]|uniref:Uncharacterized protein n=1 Tax=Dendrothele bispora (strain CBS 962.96) TaxID=1314807 RepID=A0A4S8KWS4_DENBC|nr:hypothetical protein K435DRAFT_809904 [Dendrothele bispora CBS 962.96]
MYMDPATSYDRMQQIADEFKMDVVAAGRPPEPPDPAEFRLSTGRVPDPEEGVIPVAPGTAPVMSCEKLGAELFPLFGEDAEGLLSLVPVIEHSDVKKIVTEKGFSSERQVNERIKMKKNIREMEDLRDRRKTKYFTDWYRIINHLARRIRYLGETDSRTKEPSMMEERRTL